MTKFLITEAEFGVPKRIEVSAAGWTFVADVLDAGDGWVYIDPQGRFADGEESTPWFDGGFDVREEDINAAIDALSAAPQLSPASAEFQAWWDSRYAA